eukprot:TRINITY_DN60103_c0_g1_i1.p1 TRINITY_DN60103_c0_g1~~TRINITY_DN60103_c0_g1_i1.p1  ORF type:complete len:162 (-),score=21.71 TRINITY_DN60103_c0_g1_i1:205-630(-)
MIVGALIMRVDADCASAGACESDDASALLSVRKTSTRHGSDVSVRGSPLPCSHAHLPNALDNAWWIGNNVYPTGKGATLECQYQNHAAKICDEDDCHRCISTLQRDVMLGSDYNYSSLKCFSWLGDWKIWGDVCHVSACGA